MVNEVRLFLRRLFRLGVDVKGLKVRIPTDVERLKMQSLAEKRDLYASVSSLLAYCYGLLPHEIEALTNEQLEYLVDKATKALREADKGRMSP